MPLPVIVTALSLAAGALLLVRCFGWQAESAMIAVTAIALVIVFATLVVTVVIAGDWRLATQEFKAVANKNLQVLRQWWSDPNQ